MGAPMEGFLHTRLNIILFIWFGLAVSAILITLLEYSKKTFFDDVAYRMYCRFWRRLALWWYFVVSVYLSFITDDLYGGSGGALPSFFGFLPNFLLPFSIPTLIVLAFSLLPAKLQNWYGKKNVRHSN